MRNGVAFGAKAGERSAAGGKTRDANKGECRRIEVKNGNSNKI